SSRRRNTRFSRDWSSDVCSSIYQQQGDLAVNEAHCRYQHDDDLGQLDELHQACLVELVRHLAGQGRKGEERNDEQRQRQVVEQRSEERRVGKEWRAWGAACRSSE